MREDFGSGPAPSAIRHRGVQSLSPSTIARADACAMPFGGGVLHYLPIKVNPSAMAGILSRALIAAGAAAVLFSWSVRRRTAPCSFGDRRQLGHPAQYGGARPVDEGQSAGRRSHAA